MYPNQAKRSEQVIFRRKERLATVVTKGSIINRIQPLEHILGFKYIVESLPKHREINEKNTKIVIEKEIQAGNVFMIDRHVNLTSSDPDTRHNNTF